MFQDLYVLSLFILIVFTIGLAFGIVAVLLLTSRSDRRPSRPRSTGSSGPGGGRRSTESYDTIDPEYERLIRLLEIERKRRAFERYGGGQEGT